MKKKTNRFVVSFIVEAEYAGDAIDAGEAIEELVTTLVDDAFRVDAKKGSHIRWPGVTVTDAMNFQAEAEPANPVRRAKK